MELYSVRDMVEIIISGKNLKLKTQNNNYLFNFNFIFFTHNIINKMTLMKQIEEIKCLLSHCESECDALEIRKVKASAPRLRKHLNDIKSRITPLKKQVTEVVNSFPVKKRVSKTPQEEKKEPVIVSETSDDKKETPDKKKRLVKKKVIAK